MRTKKFLMVLVAIFMGSQVTLFAQEKKGARPERKQLNKEQMQEMQCSQIIKGLALDDATAAKFTPVYKQYMEEMQLPVTWELAGMLQIERQPINRLPNRSLQTPKWSRLLRHDLRRAERCWISVRSIIMNSGNFFRPNKFRKCTIWRNTMEINSVKR